MHLVFSHSVVIYQDVWINLPFCVTNHTLFIVFNITVQRSHQLPVNSVLALIYFEINIKVVKAQVVCTFGILYAQHIKHFKYYLTFMI